MNEHPVLPLMVVGAHMNDLSQQRAEDVRRYLIDKGVPEARGDGSERPIDSNETSIGCANNCHVDFKYIRDGYESTEVAAG